MGKKQEEISLEEFHNDLRGARWKVLAESYRRWMRTGMTEEGKRLKGALNAVVVAGKCRGGHAANQVTELNGLALFDFDHCLEMLAGMKEKAGALPYVVGAFVSISGEGLKLIVRIDAENAGQYAVAYPVVARELERVLGHPCDMSCRDLGRACYASYDPEAYYNPGAGVFPWREQVDGLLQAEGECSAQSVGKACLAGVASEAGDGFMQVFLNDFDARNPFVAGGRHAFVLKLGRVARYKGFSPEEMRLLQKAVVEKYAQADFGSRRNRENIIVWLSICFCQEGRTLSWRVRGQKSKGHSMRQRRGRVKRIWRMCCSEKVKNFVGWLLTFPKRCLSICLICLRRG